MEGTPFAYSAGACNIVALWVGPDGVQGTVTRFLPDSVNPGLCCGERVSAVVVPWDQFRELIEDVNGPAFLVEAGDGRSITASGVHPCGLTGAGR